MKLTAFRVQNYRSILDSGWVNVDDIAVIVGKNESGKTSLLKALWKLNPFKEEPYSLDREWPRGRRKDRSIEAAVVSAKFVFLPNEAETLARIDQSCEGVEGVSITKLYSGKFSVSYFPHSVPRKRSGLSAHALMKSALDNATSSKPENLRAAVNSILEEEKQRLENGDGDVVGCVKELKTKLEQQIAALGDVALSQVITVECEYVIKKLEESPWDLAWKWVHSWIPTFIYMDDFLAFKGTAFLDQVKQRKDAKQLKDDDRTIIAIMEMAGLDLEEEVRKGAESDREQRMLDMNDASQTLTTEIAARWSQKKYEVQFQADGHHFITFVKDEANGALVPLEERSKGFQWFFSFDMKFMYETHGEFKNAVLLLDEPGLHLHAAAQRDLLERMKAYAGKNQLIYTTHLPFMIDMDRLDNIWVAEERHESGTAVHNDWARADKDARFTLQAALGLSWAQSLFVGQRNLVVEGVTDYWFLVTLSTLLKDAGESGLREDLVVTPAGGATKVAYVATLLAGQQLKVAALLDSDAEGIAARQQLIHNWLLKDSDVLLLGDVIGASGMFSLEDLFDEGYYLSHVSAAYRKELAESAVTLPEMPSKSVVERLDSYFEERSLHFNKGRIAKRIMGDLATKSLDDLPKATVEAFRKTIAAINEVVSKWG